MHTNRNKVGSPCQRNKAPIFCYRGSVTKAGPSVPITEVRKLAACKASSFGHRRGFGAFSSYIDASGCGPAALGLIRRTKYELGLAESTNYEVRRKYELRSMKYETGRFGRSL